MSRVALINPNWKFDGSIYFGCRSPHLPLELGISRYYLDEAGHATLLLDAHMFDLSLAEIEAELRSFRPDMVVITTAPTYLFWRCAPPELRIPQQLVRALREIAPCIVVVGPHGSTTPRAALKKLAVDIVVMGECEHSLLRLANGERDFAGLCFSQGGEIHVNGGPQAASFKDQPALRWPDEMVRPTIITIIVSKPSPRARAPRWRLRVAVPTAARSAPRRIFAICTASGRPPSCWRRSTGCATSRSNTFTSSMKSSCPIRNCSKVSFRAV